jgi:GT2 family glycosyltransferase
VSAPQPPVARDVPSGDRAELVAVSTIVVSWNSAGFLEACLASLAAQRGVEMEVVVVDNGSTDGSAGLARALAPRAKVLELGENRGFCAANNAGLAASSGAFVLFLNADAVLTEDFLEQALPDFARDPRIGMISGKLLRFDRRTVDSAGQFLTRSRRVVERGYDGADGPSLDTEGYIFSVCGAAMLCRREMIEDVSVDGEFFDESYFAFSEDIDVGWRATLAGWRSWYAPRAVAFHYRGGTESADGARRSWRPALLRRPRALRYHIIKNRWMTLLKNDAAGSFLRDLPFIGARDLALVLAGVLASPGLLMDLLRSGPVLRRARARRRSFLARRGRWGARRAGARASWVRWKAPLPVAPEGA